eukprot:15366487-Alexandrium_andersonii.AAC.1
MAPFTLLSYVHALPAGGVAFLLRDVALFASSFVSHLPLVRLLRLGPLPHRYGKVSYAGGGRTVRRRSSPRASTVGRLRLLRAHGVGAVGAHLSPPPSSS